MTSDLADRPARSFSFGPFLLLPERQLLLHDEVPVRIGGRALDILTALVEQPGELISKSELTARVWPDTFVGEGNLKVNMAALRRALGEGSGAARYIATVVGSGYRFVAPVRSSAPVPAPFPSADTAVRRHNLPTGTTRIFGRADAIETIRRELGESRLVSLVGAGGIGKTTVALAVAEQAVALFRDGVWLIDLGLQRDPTWVPNAIATTIGAAGNSADILGAVVELLRDREVLLIFDNCEHVIHGAALCIERILTNTSSVKILATSREPLRVGNERIQRLPGLITPPLSSRLRASEALTFPAIQLFVDRATQSFESFALSDGDAPAVAEICRRLDGLALAIELAATRIEAFGVGGLLKQLDDRFRLLVGRRAGPERHRTLMSTLDWSYSLLANEAALLRAVSVFAGVFDIEAAAAVAGVLPVEAADALAQLAAKSLLATDLDASGIAYRLLETTRTYCLERLRLSAEEPSVRRRHAEHVCTVLERASIEWSERPAHDWAMEYGRTLDDLRNALAWTHADTTNRTLGIRLTLAGILLWNHFSLTSECSKHVARAVEQLEPAGLLGTTFEMKLQLWLGGSTMVTRGFRAQTLRATQRALEIATQTDDTDYRLRCLSVRGIYELWTGEHEAGLRTFESFARVAAEDDPSALPESEVHSGMAELFLGRLHDARQRLERLQQQDLRYFKGAYDVRYLADTIVLLESVLAHVLWLTGFPETAARTVLTAIERARPTSHHLSFNNALSYACPIFYWSGLDDACARHVAMLDVHVVRHGLVARRPVAKFYGAALSLRDGSSSQGLQNLEQAIDEFRDLHHLARMPYYLGVLSDSLARCGRLDEAETTSRAALDSAREQHEDWCLPELLRVRASVLLRRGQAEEAEARLIESMASARSLGALSWRLRSANDLATLWQTQSRAADARHMLGPIFGEFTEGFSTRDLVMAAKLLRSL